MVIRTFVYFNVFDWYHLSARLPLELRHLRYFLAVADALHFGRAARRLHVSQPTLSQQIRQLEDELAATLLARDRRGVQLTAAGELFRAYATRAIEDVQAGQRAVAALTGAETGTLRVGYLPSLRGLVVPVLNDLLRKHPGAELMVEEGVARRIEQRVADGRLDVALGYAPTKAPEVETEALLETRLTLVVGRKHPLAAAERVWLRELSDAPFALLARGLRARSTVDAYFASHRFAPRIVLESNSVEALLSVVRSGLASTVLPEPRLAEAERLPTITLSPAPPSRLVAFLWRRGAPRSTLAEVFAQAVRERR